MKAVSIRDSFNNKFFILLIALFVEFSFANSTQVEFYFQKQSAHTLRVAATVTRLLGDSEFLAANPEFESIAARAKSALRTSLVHDKAKTLNTEYNRVLANSYGVDYRSLPDSDPRKKKITEAIKQLNARDEVFWKKAMIRFSFNKEKRKLLEQLVGAADYNDVPMSRAAEFGDGKIRKIDKASDWIQKLTHLSEDDRSGMARIAVYLESHPEKFKDIYTEITPEKLATNGTKNYLKGLKTTAKTTQQSLHPSVFIKAATTGTKALGVAGSLVTPAVVVGNYVKDPVFASPAEDFFNTVSASSELAECQTLGCARVFKECKDKNWDKERCLLEFYQKPLNEQTELRLNDDLDLILKSKTPLITGLSCKNTDKKTNQIKFTTLNYNNDLQEQELNIDGSAKIQSIKVSVTSDVRPADLIQFSEGEPQNLVLYQRPRVSKYSTDPAEWSSLTIPKKDWKDKKMYFWTSGTTEQKNQIKRSQEALRTIRYQKSALLNCCSSNQCRTYFTKLQNNKPANKQQISKTDYRHQTAK